MAVISVPSENPNAQLNVAASNAIAATLRLEIDWLDAVFSIAQTAEKRNDAGNAVRYPRVYSGNGEYIDVRYHDEFKAMCFFERNGAVQIQNSSDEPEMRFPLSLVVWADLSKVQPSNQYDYTDQLIGDVLAVLKDKYDSEIEVFDYEDRLNNVYDKYTLSDIDSRFLSYPYTAFRINFDYIHFGSLRCTNTIAQPTCEGVTILDQNDNVVTVVPPGGQYRVVVGSVIVPPFPPDSATDIIVPQP